MSVERGDGFVSAHRTDLGDVHRAGRKELAGIADPHFMDELGEGLSCAGFEISAERGGRHGRERRDIGQSDFFCVSFAEVSDDFSQFFVREGRRVGTVVWGRYGLFPPQGRERLEQGEDVDDLCHAFRPGNLSDGFRYSVRQSETDAASGFFQQIAYGIELDVVGEGILHEVFLELDDDAFHSERFIFRVFPEGLHAVGEVGSEQYRFAAAVVGDIVADKTLPSALFHKDELVFAVEMQGVGETRIVEGACLDGVCPRDVQLFVQ